VRLLADPLAARGLTLHPEKTRSVDAREPGGFDFLGYHFECGKHWPRKKAIIRKHNYHTTFPALDGKGRGRGQDHQRWPNKYFTALGLFSMTAAHAQTCQSRCENH